MSFCGPAPWFSESGFAVAFGDALPKGMDANFKRQHGYHRFGLDGREAVGQLDEMFKTQSSGNTVDGKHPKQPPGMYKTL